MHPDEATTALATAAGSRRRALELKGYAVAGSTLIAWGLVWLAGNLTRQFIPDAAPAIWIIGWIAALGWTVTRPRQLGDGRALATWLALVMFVALILALLRADESTAAMLVSLVVAAAYVVLGIWAGRRFALLGGALAVIVVLGWLAFPSSLFAILALGGGGTLILGGIWLRRA